MMTTERIFRAKVEIFTPWDSRTEKPEKAPLPFIFRNAMRKFFNPCTSRGIYSASKTHTNKTAPSQSVLALSVAPRRS